MLKAHISKNKEPDMDAADRLIRLFRYDQWATEKVQPALTEHPDFEQRDKALSLFAHLINSQELWYRRIAGESWDDLELWPSGDLQEISRIKNSNFERFAQLIEENRDDLDRPIHYQNSRGVAYESVLSDILHHLIIHSQHHRAQIATLMRIAGLTPPGTDFIFYTRTSDGSFESDHLKQN